jgi:hypothetical protein
MKKCAQGEGEQELTLGERVGRYKPAQSLPSERDVPGRSIWSPDHAADPPPLAMEPPLDRQSAWKAMP